MRLSRINNKLGAIIVLTIITACAENGSSEVELSSDANKRGIPFPAALQIESLPEDGTLSAYINCNVDNDGERRPVDDIDLTTGLIKATCDGLAPGEHTFRIEFEFESSEYGTVALATADKHLTVVAGENSVGFLETDYQYGDDDSDAMYNIWELSYGFNPRDDSDANIDGDQDGIDNLAEFNAGTNPNNLDTDSDGLNDGNEITAGRNPLINEPALLSIVQLLLED